MEVLLVVAPFGRWDRFFQKGPQLGRGEGYCDAKPSFDREIMSRVRIAVKQKGAFDLLKLPWLLPEAATERRRCLGRARAARNETQFNTLFEPLPPRSAATPIEPVVILWRQCQPPSLVIVGDRVKHVSRATARLKVSRGGFEWTDTFTITAIPKKVSQSPTPFTSGPAATFADWAPRPSAGFVVLQLRTGHS